jgi:hypothetical protein
MDLGVEARLSDALARARLAPPHALALGGLIGREEAGEGEALTDALAAGKRLRRAV